MNALTTNPKVWRILIVIAVLLTAFFALCFTFTRISIAFVIGFSLIFIAEKLAFDFNRSAARYRLSRWKKSMYGTVLFIFWAATITFLLFSSGRDLAGAVRKVRTDPGSVTLMYNQKVGPYTPKILGYRTIDRDTVTGIRDLVGPTVREIVSETAFFLIDAVLIIPLLFYMYFRKRTAISRAIVCAVPDEWREGFVRASQAIGRQLHDFFAARVLEGTVVGGLTCLGFYIAGVQGWLVLGLSAGLLNAVPYLGPFLGAVFPLFLTLSLDTTLAGLWVVLTILITQAIDEFYLKPFFLSSKVQVDALLSIILVLIGAQLFGIFGTILALPIYLVYRVVLKEAYRELTRVYDR